MEILVHPEGTEKSSVRLSRWSTCIYKIISIWFEPSTYLTLYFLVSLILVHIQLLLSGHYQFKICEAILCYGWKVPAPNFVLTIYICCLCPSQGWKFCKKCREKIFILFFLANFCPKRLNLLFQIIIFYNLNLPLVCKVQVQGTGQR